MNPLPLPARAPDPAAAAWLTQAMDPAVVAALEALYKETAVAIAARGPACWASGRCCNFERAGHRLYVTGLEAAYTVLRAGGRAGAGMGAGAGRGEAAAGNTEHDPQAAGPGRVLALPLLTPGSLGRAVEAGGCPFQQANLCGVHAVRPLGCRVYFCDASAEEWQRELYERMLSRLRALHDEHGVVYEYAEWRGLLARFVLP